jgi:hypothetical protein
MTAEEFREALKTALVRNAELSLSYECGTLRVVLYFNGETIAVASAAIPTGEDT